MLNCASSSDDHAVASCAWTVDGQTTNDSTLTLAPDTVRTYDVQLTVNDLSGNAATTNATVASVDPSVPYFEEGYLDLFPTKATNGDALVFEVAADDDYDALTALRIHWVCSRARTRTGTGMQGTTRTAGPKPPLV